MTAKEYRIVNWYGDIHLYYGDDEFLVHGCEEDSVKLSVDEVITEAELRGWPTIPECVLEQLG